MIARFIQGMGGAMMVPVGRLVLLRSVPQNEVVQALATLTIPALVGPVIGPPLGGFITTYFHWRWIFFINIPIGILGHRAGDAASSRTSRKRTPRRSISSASSSRGVGLALLMLGFATGGRHLIPLRVSIALRGRRRDLPRAYVLHARRTPYPVMQLGLLKSPTFRTSVIGGSSSASASARSRSCCR